MSKKEAIFGKLPKEDPGTSFLFGKMPKEDADTSFLFGKGGSSKPVLLTAIAGGAVAAATVFAGAVGAFGSMLVVGLVLLSMQMKQNSDWAAERRAKAAAQEATA